MDYEKKYNEALKRASELRDKALAYNANHYVKDYETIFPELRESEDERIRRRMVEHFKSKTKETWCNIPVKVILKWLEKQKEQKVISQEDFDTAKHEALWGEQNARDYCSVRDEFDLDGNLKQKPALSEDDKKIMYYVYEAVQTRYSDRELAKYLDPKIIGEKRELRRIIFDFLRNLRPSWKPSEDQMDALEKAIVRSCSHPYGVPLSELYEQLKKL